MDAERSRTEIGESFASSDPFLNSLRRGDDRTVREYLDHAHGLRGLIGEMSATPTEDTRRSVDPNLHVPFAPQWHDLVRLHYLIRSRRVTTVLEFGVGYSTAVIAHALVQNRREHQAIVESKLRRSNAFELHSVDNSEGWIAESRERLPPELRSCVTFHHSSVLTTTFQGRVCTEYEVLPNVCPDFVYIDGPSQFGAVGEVNGLSTNHPDRLPMSCDILKMEHFLLPGTLILIDGRTANARFLAANMQRVWTHLHDRAADVHYFEMVEDSLGRWNERQLEVCLGDSWRTRGMNTGG